MTGKKFDRTIAITIPDGMECEMVLDHRENVELSSGFESVDNGHKAYILTSGKKTKLHLKYF